MTEDEMETLHSVEDIELVRVGPQEDPRLMLLIDHQVIEYVRDTPAGWGRISGSIGIIIDQLEKIRKMLEGMEET